MAKNKIAETAELVVLRLAQVLPSTWETLQQTPFSDTHWKKVNATDPYKIGPLVDAVEYAAQTLAIRLRVSQKQAVLILLETCFQRLEECFLL